MKKLIIILLIIILISLSGCIYTPYEYQYVDEIIINDLELKQLATLIVSICPSGDIDCQVNEIYYYVVKNYNYYSDPRDMEDIQNPHETINRKGGDCEDLTILINSLLENLGIKTYIVLTEDHAYSLACGVNTSNLWKYVENSLLEQIAEDYSKEKGIDIILKNQELFAIEEKDESFALRSGEGYFYGGDGKKFESPVDYMNIEYSIESSQPLTLYVVSSKEQFELLMERKTFIHYSSCEKQDMLRAEDSCEYLTEYGGIILLNNNWDDATVDLNLKFLFNLDYYDLFKDQTISGYEINNQACIVLDATAGKYGYPGYDQTENKDKIAIDSLTYEEIYLE